MCLFVLTAEAWLEQALQSKTASLESEIRHERRARQQEKGERDRQRESPTVRSQSPYFNNGVGHSAQQRSSPYYASSPHSGSQML
jgi:hypothetical protein